MRTISILLRFLTQIVGVPKQMATGAALVRDLAESHLQEEAGRNLMAELRAELLSAGVNPDLYPQSRLDWPQPSVNYMPS